MADSSKVMSKKADQAKTIETFQRLRAEQRAIASKMSELDAEKTEHKSVIKALKEVSSDRRCYRLVGGVLVERQVKDVLPALEHNTQQLTALVDKLTEQLTLKGKELITYKEKNNIMLSDENKDSPTDSKPSVLVT
ncbi:prefoldin subunit 2-like [Halichondria panicea]|uniref:prefoldin subunit 2-like n=1 Tax=Halichondria panicea TaxID=6063 RepID=UPI00312BA689